MTQIVDIHAHYYPPEYLAAVSKLVDLPGQAGEAARFTTHHPFIHRIPFFSGAFPERLALMDRAGIKLQILSFSSPNVWVTDPALSTELAAVFNQATAEIVNRHPGRFKFLAYLPLPFVPEALREAERALDELGAVGFGLCTHFAHYPINDTRFYPFYEFANERESVIFLHPDPSPVPNFLESRSMSWALGAPFEDTIALYNLVDSELLERFPRISWIVPHCGGAFAAISGRIDEIWEMNPDPQRHLNVLPSIYLRRHNVYTDSAVQQANLLGLARNLFGSEHLLFGSDFPYIRRSLNDLTVALQPINALEWRIGEQEHVLYRNADFLFSQLG